MMSRFTRQSERVTLIWNQVAFFFLVGSAAVICIMGATRHLLPTLGIPPIPSELAAVLLLGDSALCAALLQVDDSLIHNPTFWTIVTTVVVHTLAATGV